ncbi:MAG: cellulose synthase operon protein YhjQ/BcsQ [Pirellulaceae bacterium]
MHANQPFEQADLSNDDQSSVIGEYSASEIDDSSAATDAYRMPTAVESKQVASKQAAASTKQARAVEANLRRARMRIFNPVWEVDNLQWPPVCLELLEEMTNNMSRVAQNLMTACEEGLQILAVTSPQSGEGSTTVACCLALLAGTHGLNVAIVDGDIENPSLSHQTNLEVDQDWRIAILDQLPLEEIAVHSINDQVTLVPLLSPIGQNEMSSDDDRIASMLQELSESFDLVVVDMGTMNSARNLVQTMGEQGLINAAVAVVDYRSSTPQRIEDCLRRIRQAGIASIGLVENFAA